jgi:hypothetical protein
MLPDLQSLNRCSRILHVPDRRSASTVELACNYAGVRGHEAFALDAVQTFSRFGGNQYPKQSRHLVLLGYGMFQALKTIFEGMRVWVVVDFSLRQHAAINIVMPACCWIPPIGNLANTQQLGHHVFKFGLLAEQCRKLLGYPWRKMMHRWMLHY